MPDRIKAITIEVATKSRRCAIVSVQNNTVSSFILIILPSALKDIILINVLVVYFAFFF